MTIVTVKNPEDYLVTDWSGGKTTQLYLYPEAGDYGERRFSFRLSTATVAIRQATFTALEGYHRLLMTLDKPITLSDIGKGQETILVPFKAHAFEGSSRIISHGTCQDMNLIFDDSFTGDLQVVWSDVPFDFPRADIHMIYALTDLDIHLNQQEVLKLVENQLAIIEKDFPLIVVTKDSLQAQQGHFPLAVWSGIWRK